MLNEYLLKQGRPSRPKKVFMVMGLISLLIIASAAATYLLANFLPYFRQPSTDFRIKFTIILNTFDYTGMDALLFIICIPFGGIGALIGGINLVRMTNRKGFLSFLHIIPGMGLTVFIPGAICYFVVPQSFFNTLPFDYSSMVPFYGYVGGAIIWGAGMVIADIFAFFYPIMNYWQFHPIYKSYREAIKAARTNSAKSRIRYYFYHYWKKKKYEEMCRLLYVEKNANKELSDVDSYVYFREGAIEKLSDEKRKQYDELFETEQYDILERELRTAYINEPTKPEMRKPEPEPEPEPDPEDEGETTFYFVEDEQLSHHGKRLVKKGRRKAANRAAREKAKAMRNQARSERRARHGR